VLPRLQRQSCQAKERDNVPVLPPNITVSNPLGTKPDKLVHVIVVDGAEQAALEHRPPIVRTAGRTHMRGHPRPVWFSGCRWVSIGSLSSNTPSTKSTECRYEALRCSNEGVRVGCIAEVECVAAEGNVYPRERERERERERGRARFRGVAVAYYLSYLHASVCVCCIFKGNVCVCVGGGGYPANPTAWPADPRATLGRVVGSSAANDNMVSAQQPTTHRAAPHQPPTGPAHPDLRVFRRWCKVLSTKK
jgi:hypothetical protein